MARKGKSNTLRKRITYYRVMSALIDAGNWTYSQHESSTSDSYLKRRISNATDQMLARVLLTLFPKKAAEQGVKLRKWEVTFDDVGKFIETIAKYEKSVS